MRNIRGFTLMELLVVIAILSILMGLILGGIFRGGTEATQRMAGIQLKAITMSALQYATAWGDFPEFDPDEHTSPRASSEALFNMLCRSYPRGEENLGPYMTASDAQVLRDNTGTPALISPLHSYYDFGFEGRGGQRILFVLVDAGRDKLLGGRLDGENGFTPDGSDGNGDGKADHLDNIVEKLPLR